MDNNQTVDPDLKGAVRQPRRQGRRMLLRRVSLVGASVMLTPLLAACGGEADDDEEDDEEQDQDDV